MFCSYQNEKCGKEKNLMKTLPIEIETMIWRIYYMDIFKNTILNELLKKIENIHGIQHTAYIQKIIRKQRFGIYSVNEEEKQQFQKKCREKNNIIVKVVSCKASNILIRHLGNPFYEYILEILKFGYGNIYPNIHSDYKLITAYLTRKVNYNQKMEKIMIELLPKID